MTKVYDVYAFILTLYVFCFSGCTSAKQHFSNFTDEYALLSLKGSITEDADGILTHNWTANTSVCNWFGVRCGVRHRRVIALDLSGMDLLGTIPPEIGNLSFLSFLKISGNKFHGSLPFELGNLRRLKVMAMRVNNITGEIPPSIGMLHELQHLDLGTNSLTGNDLKFMLCEILNTLESVTTYTSIGLSCCQVYTLPLSLCAMTSS